MRTDDFRFELPRELIAQTPAKSRGEARLLVHETRADKTTHTHVGELPSFLRRGDLLVLNDTLVRPLRFFGRRATGALVEFLLVERLMGEADTWRALVNPARKLKPGERIALFGEKCGLVMVERRELESGELDPAWCVRWEVESGTTAEEWIDRIGRMPLPPYIKRDRDGEDARDAMDRERYQTVYAREPGAVAAPTAGLHFTPELFDTLEHAGVESTFVTLHVGEGTFQPVKVEDLSRHEMHAERYRMTQATVDAVERTRARGGRVVAVGTTSVRVLESCVDEAGSLRAGEGWTRLFLYPGQNPGQNSGQQVRCVDLLLTNFHLPCSTLLMLVSAFAGRDRVLRLYEEAVEHSYRFFSYGDAMLIGKQASGRTTGK